MKIGIQQKVTDSRTLARAFAVAEMAQAQGVGINIPTMRALIDLGRTDYARTLRNLARKHDVEPTNFRLDCLCHDPSLIGDRNQTSAGLAAVRMATWVAGEAGIPAVVVPFHGRNRIEFPHESKRAQRLLAELGDEAQQVGVTLAVETDLPSDHFKTLLDGAGSDSVQAAVNTAHLCARRFDLSIAIRDLRDYLDQIQAGDVVLAPRVVPDFNVRLGRGDVDFGTVARTLRAIEFDGWFNVNAPSGDDRGQIAAANVAFVTGLFESLDWAAVKMFRAGAAAPMEEPAPA
ncbi:MAG: sugar phosphate isomerase/epimerase [Planctomycetes bacterium]|jgi:sugar phosphate isomerase/epimerase|nr:sugar phosphate isomerase/epimerase [Planctomycetota bacterium]